MWTAERVLLLVAAMGFVVKDTNFIKSDLFQFIETQQTCVQQGQLTTSLQSMDYTFLNKHYM